MRYRNVVARVEHKGKVDSSKEKRRIFVNSTPDLMCSSFSCTYISSVLHSISYSTVFWSSFLIFLLIRVLCEPSLHRKVEQEGVEKLLKPDESGIFNMEIGKRREFDESFLRSWLFLNIWYILIRLLKIFDQSNKIVHVWQTRWWFSQEIASQELRTYFWNAHLVISGSII